MCKRKREFKEIRHKHADRKRSQGNSRKLKEIKVGMNNQAKETGK